MWTDAVADVLENMSPAEGMAYNAKLAPIARGDVLPDRLYYN